MLAYALAERFKRFEAGGTPGGMDADAFGRAVIHGNEHRGLALAGNGRCQVGAPHRVYRLGNYGPVMAARTVRRSDPRRGEQVVLPHEPQHPAFRGSHARDPQSRPHLAVAFAIKGASGEDGPDCREQWLVRHRPDWATALRSRPSRSLMPVDGCTRHPPNPADQCETVGLAAAWRDGPAHRFHLLRAKGRPPSRLVIFCSRSSCFSSISPSRAFSCSLSSVSPSTGLLVNAASPAARNESRHVVSVAAVTPSERDTVSRASPRSSRSTASRLPGRDMRPPRPPPTADGAVVVCVVIMHLFWRTTSAYEVSHSTVGRRNASGLEQRPMTPVAGVRRVIWRPFLSVPICCSRTCRHGNGHGRLGTMQNFMVSKRPGRIVGREEIRMTKK